MFLEKKNAAFVQNLKDGQAIPIFTEWAKSRIYKRGPHAYIYA